MPKMVRKQVYIEPYQEAGLKAQAAASGMTEAELIRRGIDFVLAGAGAQVADPKAWAKARELMHARLNKPALPGKRGWTREDLYAERLDRWPR